MQKDVEGRAPRQSSLRNNSDSLAIFAAIRRA
jgi:hypothetical protein